MPPVVRNEKSSRVPSIELVSAAQARAKVVARAKTVFRRRLREAELKLPKAQADLALTAFDRAMTDLISGLSKVDDLLERIVEGEGTRPKEATAPSQPNARLRRAMTRANKIECGRFSTADELLRSLGQAIEK